MAAYSEQGCAEEHVRTPPSVVRVSDTDTLTGPNDPWVFVMNVARPWAHSSVPAITTHCQMRPVPPGPNPVPLTDTAWPVGARFVEGETVSVVPGVSANVTPAGATSDAARIAAAGPRRRARRQRARVGPREAGEFRDTSVMRPP